MTEEIRGALTPWASLESATARSMTRTCCTPPLSSSRKVFRSWFVTSIRRAGRAIPQVCTKTFLNGIVLLEILQAVADLESPAEVLYATVHAHISRAPNAGSATADWRRFLLHFFHEWQLLLRLERIRCCRIPDISVR